MAVEGDGDREQALRESEERFRLVTASTTDIIYEWDLVSGALEWFGPVDAHLGYADGEFPRSLAAFVERIHPEDRAGVMAATQDGMQNGRRWQGEYRVVRKDGSLAHWWGTGLAACGPDGQPRRVIGAITDITVRKTAEEALRQSEARLRALSDNLRGGLVYQIDSGRDGAQRRFLYISAGVVPLHGVTVDEALADAERIYGQVFEEDRRVVVEREAQALAAMAPFDAEVRVRLPSGQERWRLFSSSPRRLEDGRVVWDGIELDITARKVAEVALRQERALYLDLMNTQPAGTYRIRVASPRRWLQDAWRNPQVPPYAFEHLSPRFCEVLGVERERVERRPGIVLELVHPEDRAEFARLNEEANLRLVPFRWEGRLLQAGRERWVHFESLPRTGEDGDVIWTGTLYDITERVQAERKHARLEEQLRLSQKMEAVGRLAGGVAHDFNNMLGVILGHAELALAALDPRSPLAADLAEIRRAAERSADLTRQLLAFARKQTIAPVALELNQAVDAALKMLGRLLGEDIELVWAPGEDAGAVLMDPTQLDQILANLCLNARDAIASAGQGRIVVRTGRRVLDEAACASLPGAAPGAYAVITVQDTGGGMDEQTLDRLFEPFFTTKVLGRGTGLGLSTVHGIVTQNHGHIGVTSAPGQGTTFEILLPATGSAEQAAGATPDRPAPERGRETILLVEDEPAILRVGQRMLERLGYTVVPAVTPGEALELARRHPGEIDLLMTDVVMPEMNGRELARNLQALFPGIRRLFMSGYTADVIAHHGVLDEGVHFLQKPFNREELAARVRAALDG